ncbi:hypothetical protein ACA910_011343 [Epithemia clementina (nom. ined.)]
MSGVSHYTDAPPAVGDHHTVGSGGGRSNRSSKRGKPPLAPVSYGAVSQGEEESDDAGYHGESGDDYEYYDDSEEEAADNITSDDNNNDNDAQTELLPKYSTQTSSKTTTTSPSTPMSIWTIVAILSTAFSYGCIFSTLFLITLPVECERINQEHPTVPKSVSLGVFVAIAGVTQLISPLVGRLSDIYIPPAGHELGQRLPFLVLGAVCTIMGLLGQMLASYGGFWVRYSAFFFLHMLGLNIMYAMMLALLPDQVPQSQTGMANGILALELVLGSLFGFALFYAFFYEYIQSMYSLYIINIIVSTIATGTHAHDRDAELSEQRRSSQQRARREHLARYFKRHSSRNAGTTTSESPLVLHPHHRRRRRWHKAAKKAARKAQQVLVMTPTMILKSMLVDTVATLDWAAVLECYTIDVERYPDFSVVTLSRLFYYSGMSIQTFFLYYVHDVLHVTKNPQGVVAGLAIIGQCSAALTCYPVGVLSDRYMQGERRPLVYLACVMLSAVSLSLIWIQTLEQMMVAVLLLGSANGIYLTMDTSLAVDTLPKGKHLEDSAQLLGVWGVAAFLGSALGPMIGGPLLYRFGKQVADENTQALAPTAAPTFTSNSNDDHLVFSVTAMNDDELASESYDWEGYALVLSLGSIYFVISALTLFCCLSRSGTGKNGSSSDSSNANNDSDNSNGKNHEEHPHGENSTINSNDYNPTTMPYEVMPTPSTF